MTSDRLSLFATPPHDCSYFPGRKAGTLFADPNAALNDHLYQLLLERGFRRSGSHVYRPECPDCRDCISLRLPADQWRPRRNQRRCWNRIADQLEITVQAATFEQGHFDLYTRYIDSRHADGDMANPSPDSYLRFLSSDWCTTRFVEFRLQGCLLAVAVTDFLPAGLSAVYTFFEPELAHLSPGTLSLVWQIQETRRLGLPHLYLGYWIADSRKMAYKNNYRPNEHYINERWGAGAD